MNGYSIACDGKSIKCLECGMTSYNPMDVKMKYCGNCHFFHDDRKLEMEIEKEKEKL